MPFWHDFMAHHVHFSICATAFDDTQSQTQSQVFFSSWQVASRMGRLGSKQGIAPAKTVHILQISGVDWRVYLVVPVPPFRQVAIKSDLFQDWRRINKGRLE